MSLSQASPIKLNTTSLSNLNFQPTPDGSLVVFSGDHETPGVTELFSVPITGGTPVKLNDTPVSGGDVSTNDFQITPDGSRVIFQGDLESVNVTELFSVPISGGSPVKLNDTPVSGGDVSVARVTPDGSHVVFTGDLENDNVNELFSVPITGGTPIKLNNTPVSGGAVAYFFQITPDGSHVIFRGDLETDSVFELFSVPVTGGTPVKLNNTPLSGAGILSFQITPDSSRVIYRGDLETFKVYELFSVPVTGGTQVKLNDTSLSGEGVFSSFQVSPDSSRAIYTGDLETDGIRELFSVPIAGGTNVKLNTTPLSGGDVASTFQITPDSSRVIFYGDLETENVRELFSIPIAGGTPVKLHDTLLTGEGVSSDFLVTPDGARVIFRGKLENDNVYELFSTPVAGGSSTKLNNTPVSGGNVSSGFQVTPNSSRVIFAGDLESDSVSELFYVPVAGGTILKLHDTPVFGGDVYSNFKITTDGLRVVFPGDLEIDNANDLFAAPLEARWGSLSGSWFSAQHWEGSQRPLSTSTPVAHTKPGLVIIDSLFSQASAYDLDLGGGPFLGGRSILELRNQSGLTLGGSLNLREGGLIRGDGIVSALNANTLVHPGAELLVGSGQTLTIATPAFENQGRLEAFGTAFGASTLEIAAPATNSGPTGVIEARDAILRFPGGLTNSGSLTFANGFNDFVGSINNQPGGLILVSRGATLVFHDDVINSGIINASASANLISSVVFYGDFSGNGVSGTGDVFIEGDARPGFSPGLMNFGGNLTVGPISSLNMELSGTTPGSQYDQINVDEHFALGGSLVVTLNAGFTPSAGDSFDLWNAPSSSGTFSSVSFPALPSGLFWQSDQLILTGEISVGLVPESYEAFSTLFSLSEPFDGDDDRDGIPNGLEYILATDPTTTNTNLLPLELSRGGDLDTLSTTIAQPGANDVTLIIESSTTLLDNGLGAWAPLATRTNGIWSNDPTIDPNGAGLAEISLDHTSTGPRRFYRLRAMLIP